MKKLTLALAIVCMALLSQASYINWAINTMCWKNQNGEYAPQGTTVWMYDNDYADSIVAALKNKSVVDFTTSGWENQISGLKGIYATGYTDNDKGMLSESTIFHEDLIDVAINEDEYVLGSLLIDMTSSPDTVYYNLTTAINGVYATDDMSVLDIVNTTWWRVDGGTGWQVAQSVPEPTSGMLMLIGFASMALRRRRV